MMDLIDRQAAIDAAFIRLHPAVFNEVAEILREVPAADVVERKNGKWVYKGNTGWHCSECGGQAPFWCLASTQSCSPFCPSCGAEMVKGEEDEVV